MEVNDHAQSKILFAKYKLVPLKEITIPRGELLAARIGARAVQFVKKHLQIEVPIFAWSDSKCVISWLKNEKFEKFFSICKKSSQINPGK